MQPRQFLNSQQPQDFGQNLGQNYNQQPISNIQHQYYNQNLASSINLPSQIYQNTTQVSGQQPLIVNMTKPQQQQRSMIIPQTQTQVITSPQKQQQYEVHHIERPLEVITIDEIENPWRLKCSTLERQILELQIQLRKGGIPQVSTIEVFDDTKVKVLEKKINELKNIADDRDQELQELNQRISDLQQEIEESSTSKTTYIISELNTWKAKFEKLNVEYNHNATDLSNVSTELEILQKQNTGGGQSAARETGRSQKIY